MTRRLTVDDLIARAEVSDVVNQYATGIDRRDWSLFRACFADETALDFSSWNNSPPVTLTPQLWTDGVAAGLSGFDATQHVSSNHVHTINGDEAQCVSYMVALHHLVIDGARHMHAIGGYYTNDLRRLSGGWKIHRCKLTVTWEMGDRGLFDIARARHVAKAS